jgi:hypothetical protein
VAKIVSYLLNAPVSVLLLILGFFGVIWGSLSILDVKVVHITLESPARYIVMAISALLIVVALLVARVEQLNRVTTKKISIDDSRVKLAPYPEVRLKGEVAPKKAGVKVWLVREDRANRGGQFFPSTAPAVTTANGAWEQTISLWQPGPFDVHAVVTTAEYDMFYRVYREAYKVALNILKLEDPEAYYVPGWPFFDDLPKVSVSAVRRIDL